MRRTSACEEGEREVETPTCPEFGAECVRSGVKKMMEVDAQGHCLIMSVAVNKRMLWPSRQRPRMRLKLYVVITTKVKDIFKVGVSCQKSNWCWCDQFAEEKQQKLEEKAVENQTEDQVESQVDEAMESQDQRTRFRW